MTHDELLSRIETDRLNDDAGFLAPALVTVVGLHEPVPEYNGDGIVCNECSNSDTVFFYPCKTIQAIEKELKGW